MPECGNVKGAFSSSDVNIGWYGYETTKNSHLRVGPGDRFPSKHRVVVGKRVGVQSTRNPKGIDNPPQRPARPDEHGRPWVWAYVLEGGHTGWMKKSVLKERHDKVPWAHGPGHKDFHIGLEKCAKGPDTSCHGARRNRVRIISSEDVYLRYAPHSTAYHYLCSGDTVRELYRRTLNDYSAVSVVQSKTAPVGARGWVSVGSLAGEKVSGIDVSVFQGTIDFNAVHGAGEDFVICKATEGQDFIDKSFYQNVKKAREAKLHVGGYHFLRPRPGRSGRVEADEFIHALRHARLGKGDIRPTLDVEVSKLDRDRTERYVGEFIGAMRLAGLDCMLYTYPAFLHWTKAFSTDLWIAHYEVKRPTLPGPWDEYVLWQYTSSGHVPGVAGRVDRNKCPDLSRIIQR